MGPLIGAGAILVSAEPLRQLETRLNQLCNDYNFPVEDHKESEFKWSPGAGTWMKQHVIGSKREAFLLDVTRLLKRSGAKLIVVLEDCNYGVADTENSSSPEDDVLRLLFERINSFLRTKRDHAIVIHDRPSGGTTDENAFLYHTIDMLRTGTRFVNFTRLALNPVCAQSRFVRSLQAADVAIGCVAAHVAGEENFSPPIFRSLLPLFYQGVERIGGYGLKIHPTIKHVNLYHWLLNDEVHINMSLPCSDSPHAEMPPHIKACRLWEQVAAEAITRRPLLKPWVDVAHPHRVEDNGLRLRFHREDHHAAAGLYRPNTRRFIESIFPDFTNGYDLDLHCETFGARSNTRERSGR
jgi:hypothetical protein